MIGIILAGGEGTRYYPNTLITSKHLLPLYNKPIIYYSLALLMEANIREIIMIVSEHHFYQYTTLLGDGSNFGIKLCYVVQKKSLGTAHALSLVKDYIKGQYCVLAFGDNYINSTKVCDYLKKTPQETGATIFAYKVDTPSDYGIIEFSLEGKVLSLEEKPRFPKSNFAMIGLILFDPSVCEKLENVTISNRNEYEITDVLNQYLCLNQLRAVLLDETDEWSDLGNAESVTFWSNRIMIDEQRNGVLRGYLEEIALRKGWLSPLELLPNIINYRKSQYGNIILNVLKNKYEVKIDA